MTLDQQERGELARIIMSPESFDGGPASCGPNEVYAARTADAILSAGFRKPRQVTTAEELDTLPIGTVLRCRSTYGAVCVLERGEGSYWEALGGEDIWSDEQVVRHYQAITVLHEPGAS